MVQALSDLINNEFYEETSVKEVFSFFKCSKNIDVENFLKNKAIDFEKQNISRTYLIIDDNALSQDKIIIQGYFTLAIKSVQLNEVSNNLKRKLSKTTSNTSVAAFLLAQIAKDDNTPKGFGKIILQNAIEYIKLAQKYIGGRFLYLDCKQPLIEYYKNYSFKYLQQNPQDKSLVQLYTII